MRTAYAPNQYHGRFGEAKVNAPTIPTMVYMATPLDVTNPPSAMWTSTGSTSKSVVCS